MGKNNSKLLAELKAAQGGNEPEQSVSFDSFEVLRAIGRGAFGKVCLVEHKRTNRILAMKYVNKQACLRKSAVENICAEVEMLRTLEHPFVVKLCYTFQDVEDLFIILEPLLGGDLRYHMSVSDSPLDEEVVRFICIEIASALDFLKEKRIVHRDVKPDNILLDDSGHAHLTDFNVAAKIENGRRLLSMAGTKPYLAPEMFKAGISPSRSSGYSFAVDWWALGVTAYELLAGQRPFDIHSRSSLEQNLAQIKAKCDETCIRLRGSSLDCESPSASSSSTRAAASSSSSFWSPDFATFLRALLTLRPHKRLASLQSLMKLNLARDLDVESLMSKSLSAPFVPDKQTLNCDPTYELEEMILETKPLHKKKKRLLRQQTLLTEHAIQQALLQKQRMATLGESAEEPSATSGRGEANEEQRDPFLDFPNYNRDYERYQALLNEKELKWEAELKQLMEADT